MYFKKDKNYDEILFVTENKNDFADKSNANQLHPNLKKESLKNLKFTNNIRDVIRCFDVSDKYKIIETVIEKQDQLKHVYEDKYYQDCECCGEELHVNLNIERIDRNLHYKCPHCGHSKDTGLDYHQTITESGY